jgi:hypothetical protein
MYGLNLERRIFNKILYEVESSDYSQFIPGMWCHVGLVRTDVLKKCVTSIFRVE